jgi:hypothetical protein
LLCHDHLYFANPLSFNDPLDSKPTLEIDSSLQDLRELLTFLVRRRVRIEISRSLAQANVDRDKAKAHAQRHANLEAIRVLDEIAHYATDAEYEVTEEQAETHLLTHRVHEELTRYYERGVCCFSTTHSNPLLWSHYGDQHRGLCVGYDLLRRPRPMLRKVLYGGNRIIKTSTLVDALLKSDTDAKASLNRDMLLRKARGWSYEREWRLLGKQGVQDSPLRLKEVTFGLRCPSSVIHTVVKALQTPGRPVRVFKIYETHGNYRLGRTEVDLNELNAYFPRPARSGEEIFGSLVNET